MVEYVATVVSLVQIFLIAFQQPSVVTQLCWKDYELVDFTKKVMTSEPLSVRHVRHLGDIDEVDVHKIIILLNLACPDVEGMISLSTDKLNSDYRWLLIDTSDLSNTADKAIQLFKNVPILQGSQIYVLANFQYPTFELYRLYRNSLSMDLIQQKVLTGDFEGQSFEWSSEHQSVAISRQQPPGLAGMLVNASLVITHNNSMEHLTDYVDKHLDTISKVNYLLTKDIMNFLNATVRFSVVSSWGYLDNETGHWDGMIGELVRRAAQVGASPLFFTADRVGTIQYLSMTSPTKSKFVFQAPKLSYTENVFLLPFESDVWLSIGGLIFVVIFSLRLVTLADVYVIRYKNLLNATETQIGWIRLDEICTIVLGATCQQGFSEVPYSLASCIVVMVTFISLYSLFISYSATIVALLQSPSSKIKTLDDLLSSRLKFGVDDTVFNRYYFSHQTEHTRRAIYEQKVLNRDGSMMLYPLEQGVNKIREGLFAFHMELGAGYKFVSETFFEHEKCTLKELQFYELIDPWYAIQQNSSLKEMIKISLFRVREHGIQARENDHLYTKKPVCQGIGGAFVTVGIVDVKPALLVLLWGFLFSSLIFLIEFFVNRVYTNLQHRRERNNSFIQM